MMVILIMVVMIVGNVLIGETHLGDGYNRTVIEHGANNGLSLPSSWLITPHFTCSPH